LTRRVADKKRPCLILADGASLARQVARAAALAGLRVLAPPAAGQKVRGQPVRLVALHRRQTLAQLFRLAAELPAGQSLLLLVGQARGALDLGAQQMWPEPTGAAVARALGLPTLETPAELAQAARLTALGLGRVRRIGAVAASEDEAALLADALQRAALAAEVEVMRSARRLPRGCELVLVSPDVRLRPRRGVTLLTFSAAGETGPKVASPSTLSALAALQRISPRPTAPAPTAGDRPAARRAAKALDGWPARLHQAQVAQLLACHGLRAPAWGLARSASHASAIARRVGLPVIVSAMGTEPRLAAIRSGADSLSGCRQAFRDVLRACGRMRPQPDLEGVMVSAAAPPVALECALFWPPDLPPLLLMGRPANAPQVHLCPLHPDAAAGAVAELLGPRARDEKKLARLLVRLSRIGPGLADRMRWLRVGVVSPAQVVAGRAEQTEGLRAPPWL
jgi:hypothetical protein